MKTIIFDLDGLLIDSSPCWKEADLLLAKKLGFNLTTSVMKQFLGRGLRECAQIMKEEYHLNNTIDELVQERLQLVYPILFQQLTLLPYARELIMKLHANKYVLSLATAGHTVEMVRKILDTLGILQYFAYMKSGLDFAHSKPAPDIYLAVAKEIETLPSNCIVLEDSANGVVAGKAAGMEVFGVNKKDEMRTELTKAGADLVFSNLDIPLKTFE